MVSKSQCAAVFLLAASLGFANSAPEVVHGEAARANVRSAPKPSLLRSEAPQEAVVSRHEPALLDASEATSERLLDASEAFAGLASSTADTSVSTDTTASAVIVAAGGGTENCADKEDSGRMLLGGTKGKAQTCGELMYSYRHYASASACTDKKHGATVRRNCQRSCGCCCEDGLHSGTHDDNGLEVTCAQLVVWTTELKFDYCADEQYGATIRENCRQLCCTCDSGIQLDHLWQQAGERDVNKSIPYSQVRQELNDAMHRISQLAEGVEAMAGRVPGIMGIISGSTTAAPRPHGAHGDTASTTPGSGYYDSP